MALPLNDDELVERLNELGVLSWEAVGEMNMRQPSSVFSHRTVGPCVLLKRPSI